MERARKLSKEALEASKPFPKRPRAGSMALVAYALRIYVKKHYREYPPRRLEASWLDAEQTVHLKAWWDSGGHDEVPF